MALPANLAEKAKEATWFYNICCSLLTSHSGPILPLSSLSWAKCAISRQISALLLSSSPRPQGGKLLAANLRATSPIPFEVRIQPGSNDS